MKSAGNAVISTFPAHCPHGLQHLRHKRPTFAFTSESGYTLGFRRRIAHSGLHAETGGVSDGGGITTLGLFHTFTNIPGPGIRTASFAAFGAWSGVLPKNAESPRDSDAHDARRCPAGVAAPLGCVICLQLGDVAVFSLCAQYFLNVRGGGGITTLGAFHTFRKPCVAGYQNGKLCRFWVLAGCAPKERREPRDSDAHDARRCPEASRPRRAA